jgi:hypothetical protein
MWRRKNVLDIERDPQTMATVDAMNIDFLMSVGELLSS